MRDKNCSVKKMAYTQVAELQAAADRHDTRTFFHGLKAVYGPREVGSAIVKSLDGVTLTDRTKILERWREHFETVLN